MPRKPITIKNFVIDMNNKFICFNINSNGSVEDRSGYKIKLYDDTLDILKFLKSKGICLAAASRQVLKVKLQ